MLEDIVLKNLRDEGILVDQRHTHLVVAYSGGVDSTVLLHLLAKLREKENLSITAAYYNHGWRQEQQDEFAILHQNAAAAKVPLVLIQADRTLPKSETAARTARYRALAGLARDTNAHALLTAHQADDQIETILFHIFRGTGIEGLVGIQKRLLLTMPGTEGAPPVLRPMLDIYREGINRYVQANNLSYFEDPTNSNTKFHRNAIRREIIPMIQERFPQAKSAMIRLSELAQGDLQIIDDKTDPIWEQVYKDNILNSIAFNQLARPYQRRVIKRFLTEQGFSVDFHSIEEIIDFVQGESRNNLSVGLKSLECEDPSKNRFLSLYKNQIQIIERDKVPVETEQTTQEFEVVLPGDLRIECFHSMLRATALTNAERKLRGLLRPRHSKEIVVDLWKYTKKPLVLRTRRKGDRIQPFGMPVPMRLKNYLINKGIPRFERDQVLMLACGNEILWVIGYGVSEKLRVGDGSSGDPTAIYRLEYMSLDNIPPEPVVKVTVPAIEDVAEIDTDTELETESEVMELEPELATDTIATEEQENSDVHD